MSTVAAEARGTSLIAFCTAFVLALVPSCVRGNVRSILTEWWALSLDIRCVVFYSTFLVVCRRSRRRKMSEVVSMTISKCKDVNVWENNLTDVSVYFNYANAGVWVSVPRNFAQLRLRFQLMSPTLKGQLERIISIYYHLSTIARVVRACLLLWPGPPSYRFIQDVDMASIPLFF